MASPHGDNSDNQRHHTDELVPFRTQFQNGDRGDETGSENDDDDRVAHVARTETEVEFIFYEDEGCVIDLSEETRGYCRYPLATDQLPQPASKNGGLTKGTLPDDSGFSSRMSEDSASVHRIIRPRELRKAVTEVAILEEDKGNPGG